jgi:glycosyltransferase involved in cell wall biosynthesis
MGGIGSYVRNVSAGLVAAGHDVHVFTFDLPTDARAHVPPGVNFHETPDLATRVDRGLLPAPLAAALNAGGDGVYRLAIAQLLTAAFLAEHARQAFDVVEVPEVEALGLPLLLNPSANVPVVTHLHCATAIAYEGNRIAMGAGERLITALEFAAIALSDAICAPTRAVVELTRQHMAGTAVEAEIIPHSLATADKPILLPPGDGPVLFVGRLERLKGCEILAAALVLFLNDNPAATFRFAAPDTNTGPGGRSMRRHIEALLGPELGRRVTFLGEAPRATIDAELAAASFCVMPSLRENFSMALCEAMAAGRAVVVAGGTGSVEVVGDDGLVAERGSAADLAKIMTRLWRDRTQLKTQSLKAHERVKTLCDPARVARQRVAFYASVIERFTASCGAGRAGRLSKLPPSCAGAVLPAVVALAGAMSGCAASGVTTPGTRLLRICETIERQTGRPATVTLYGAGKHTTRLLSERHLWESHGHRVAAVMDDHPRFTTTPAFLGLPVRSVSAVVAAKSAGETIPPVVLSTDTYEDQFWQQTAPLRALGVAVFRLYSSE